jgi:hypothetical protein
MEHLEEIFGKLAENHCLRYKKIISHVSDIDIERCNLIPEAHRKCIFITISRDRYCTLYKINPKISKFHATYYGTGSSSNTRSFYLRFRLFAFQDKAFFNDIFSSFSFILDFKFGVQ